MNCLEIALLFLAAAAPGIVIYIDGWHRWGRWDWWRRH